MRAVKAAQLLERGFGTGGGLAWLKPSLGNVESLAPIDAAPPNLRDDMCGPHRKRRGPATDDDNAEATNGGSENVISMFAAATPSLKPSQLLAPPGPVQPVVVYTGPKKTGAALVAADAAEELKQTPVKKKKSRVAKKPQASAEAKTASAKPDTNTANAKPVSAKPVNAKPVNAKADRVTSAKPKAAAKPPAGDAAVKPKPKAAATSSETKPKS